MRNSNIKKIGSVKEIHPYDLVGLEDSINLCNDRKTEVTGNLSNTFLEDGKFHIVDEGFTVDAITPTALKQIWGEAGFNTAQVDLISNHLTDKERADLYEREIADKLELDRMFRVHTDKNGIKKLYGVVSPRYKIMDNDVVMDIIHNSDMSLVPIRGTEVNFDHSKFRLIPEDITGLQVGDHFPMMEITNSESGIGSLNILAGTYTVKCTNGMLVAEVCDKVRSVHMGMKKFVMPDLSKVMNHAKEKVEQLFKAEAQYLNYNDKVTVLDFAKSRGISHDDINAAVNIANAAYDGGSTLANVVGAFTHSAQRWANVNAVRNGLRMDTARRTKIEVVAGEILQRFAA